jgi:hypothetical protein
MEGAVRRDRHRQPDPRESLQHQFPTPGEPDPPLLADGPKDALARSVIATAAGSAVNRIVIGLAMNGDLYGANTARTQPSV